MKIVHVALLLALALPVLAQAPPDAATLKQMMANPKLKHYTWKAQTQTAVAGQLKSTVVQQITWTPSGQQQKLEISRTNADVKKPAAPMRRLLAKRKASKSKEWFQGLEQQLNLYRHPTPEQMGALSAGLSNEMAGGQLILTGQNFVQPDDKLVLFLNPKTNQPTKGEVVTRYDDSEVKIHLEFSQLEPGLATVSKTVCEIPDHEVVITVINSDYRKN